MKGALSFYGRMDFGVRGVLEFSTIKSPPARHQHLSMPGVEHLEQSFLRSLRLSNTRK